MESTAAIVEALGGEAAGMGPLRSLQDLESSIREGLPYASLEAAMSSCHLDMREVTAVLHLSPRTQARRKAEQRLSPDESDRLVRMVRLITQAREVLDDEDRAVAWLRTPNRALGGRVPLALLDTDLGARQVEQVLGRIEHGVFS
jgi:putative toxin-antitoxin system antitoxin component (TIGR02293 family)